MLLIARAGRVAASGYRRATHNMSDVGRSIDYAKASRQELIARIAELENKVDKGKGRAIQQNGEGSDRAQPSPDTSSNKSRKREAKREAKLNGGAAATTPADFFDRYPRRKIALRFSYEGWLYGGLALQSEDTPLPTVEGVLLDALVQARLIADARNLDGMDFSRCGRTDRGVSAAGQVVALYVRSQLREPEGREQLAWEPAKLSNGTQNSEQTDEHMDLSSLTKNERNNLEQKMAAKAKPKDELPYISLLNRALPSSIRILAWSPVQPDFNARFSCSSRHYKYFFSRMPTDLDIGRMQDAADRLVGEHDFRNFCKIDPTKQITNYRRRVMSAKINRVGGEKSHNWVLDLQGTAFLYHQVRHIMAILFLVGSGSEKPNVVDAMLNTGYWDAEMDKNKPMPDPNLEVVPTKPSYEMADDLPLVLWDCKFPVGTVDWQKDAAGKLASNKVGSLDKTAADMLAHHQQLELKSTITSHFLDAYSGLHAAETAVTTKENGIKSRHEIQLGGGNYMTVAKYTPLLKRPRGERAEIINKHWAEGQGKRRALRKAAQAKVAANDGDGTMVTDE